MNYLRYVGIDPVGKVYAQVETDDKKLIQFNIGTLKSLGIEDLKAVDEKPILEQAAKIIADRKAADDAAKAAYPDERIAAIEAELIKLTEEKTTLTEAKEAEAPKEPIK